MSEVARDSGIVTMVDIVYRKSEINRQTDRQTSLSLKAPSLYVDGA